MKKPNDSKADIAHYSGHETFPLRQMWLKKACEHATSDNLVPKASFTNEDAIAKFGVGKNMVASIRHWALACNILTENNAPNGFYRITDEAFTIFSEAGFDPYSENPTTTWYAHWHLAGVGNRSTTWRWLFNYVTTQTFSREDLEVALANYAKVKEPNRKISPATLSRDIETCIRSYAPRLTGGTPEDYAEPMLGELGIIFEEKKGHFAFRRGPKTTIHDGMFVYALLDFWERTSPTLSSLAFEAIAFGEGSPGRVFKLDENSIAERLLNLDDLTKGSLSWTTTAGLRQVHKKTSQIDDLKTRMIELAYV